MQKLYLNKVNALKKLSSLEQKALNAFSVSAVNKYDALITLLDEEEGKCIEEFRKYLSRMKSDGFLSEDEETLLYNMFEIRRTLILESLSN